MADFIFLAGSLNIIRLILHSSSFKCGTFTVSCLHFARLLIGSFVPIFSNFVGYVLWPKVNFFPITC